MERGKLVQSLYAVQAFGEDFRAVGVYVPCFAEGKF